MLQQPLMLAWIGGAALPLVVHLLSRSRYRAVPWGAMMFLNGPDSGSEHAARFKQISLLLCRMAMIGFLAVALARPVISAQYASVPTAGLTTGGPAAVVIILDDSASMGYTQNGKSRLDEARQVTLQILGSLKRGDQATLLLAGAKEYQPAVPPSPDLQTLAGRITDLEPDTGAADFAVEIDRAADLLEHTSAADGEIDIICDHQATNWRNVTDAFKQRWKSRRGPVPRLTVIPVGDDASDNLAIDAIEIPDHMLIRDQPSTVQVRVHNYGSTSQPAVPVSLWSAARALGETTIDVPAHSVKTAAIPAKFYEVGSRVLSASVKSTGLTTDDRLDVAADVIDPLQVLMVTGQTATSRPTTQSVNKSSLPGRRGGELAEITIVPFSNWQLQQQKFDEMILSDVPEFTTDQQSALRQFVAAGGGVLFMPGIHSNVANYNKILYDNGRGILPAMLRPMIVKTTRIENISRQQSVFKTLPALSTPLSIPQFFPTGQRLPDARIIARLAPGDPWLIESSGQRGRVLLMTAAEAFSQISIQQSIIRYLGGGKAIDRNLSPGQALVAVVDEPVDDRSATVQFVSGGPREPAITNQSGAHTEIRYVKTLRSGTYRLRYRTDGKEKLINYVVPAPRNDSDLTPLTDDQWKTLNNRLDFHRVDLAKTTITQAMDTQRGSREIWIDLLAAVLFFMTAETLLARR